MFIEQLYTNCLSHAAYYIESNGEAAIIDPLRDPGVYINKAKERHALIKYVFETHFHADFVSGHLDLAAKTGAFVVLGPQARPSYSALIATHEQEFKLGNILLKVLHTPGHTPESVCILLKNEEKKDHALFTGDTLFIGDVGRPDLALSETITAKDLAGDLYNSIKNEILPLSDEIIIYPGHGAGSLCGKNLSKETFSTLGEQKTHNYALQAKSKEEFVKVVTSGLDKPPQYFPKNALLNKQGYACFDEIIRRGSKLLSIKDFEDIVQRKNALLLDTRDATDFAAGHIPNSINIGLNGQFASWVGTLLTDINQNIAIVAPAGKEKETVMRLSRVGYDNSLGCLNGGFETWCVAGKPINTVPSINPVDFNSIMQNETTSVLLDLRTQGEFDKEHMNGALNVPLSTLNENINTLDKFKTYYLYCVSGYRSMIAASILHQHGFAKVMDVKGGINAIKKNINNISLVKG